MRKQIFIILFHLFCFKASSEGCPGFNLWTTNGINISETKPIPYDETHISKIDTIIISVYRQIQCGGASFKYLQFENDTLSVLGLTVSSIPNGGFSCKVLGKPGFYIVHVTTNSAPSDRSLSFRLIWDPVGINDASYTTSNTLLLYPNPSNGEINLQSEKESIKSVTVHNLNAQKLLYFDVNETLVKLNLNILPPGIYYLQIATLPDKIIIKKVVIR